MNTQILKGMVVLAILSNTSFADSSINVGKDILSTELEKHENEEDIVITNETPSFHSQFVLPEDEESILKQIKRSKIVRRVLKEIKKKTGMTIKEILDDIDLIEELKDLLSKKDPVAQIKCRKNNPYRTYDGSCNNMQNPTWGMAGQIQLRLLEPEYNDGISEPRILGNDGNPLPGPREISNIVHREGKKRRMSKNSSVMVMQWGQFLDHDLVATPVVRNEDGSALDCCGNTTKLEDDDDSNGCFSIEIPPDDPHFHDTCMPMSRSASGVGPDADITQRQQLNKITAYIDASNVYGSSNEAIRRLRGTKGLLKTSRFNLLPRNENQTCIVHPNVRDFCQLAGDERVNVNPSLGSIHTLFVREHNRIAKMLANSNPDWKSNVVFEEARKIIGALMQHITYTEYLPIVLGDNIMKAYDLSPRNGYDVDMYDDKINAGISNVFSTAAFRFGHSSIPNKQGFKRQSGKLNVLPLEDTFHRPFFIQQRKGKGFKENTRWLYSNTQPETDRSFVPAVQDLLFLNSNFSLDLVSLNINRGRDHGIPSYNSWRKYCGLKIAKSFKQLTDHDKVTRRRFKRAYRHVNDIDVYSGGVSERSLQGAEVGPLFGCLLGDQFKKLKVGDRFWYERRNDQTGFTEEQLNSIKEMTLSKIICENLGIQKIQRSAFKVVSSDNEEVNCSSLPDLNIQKWAAADVDD